MKKVSILSLCFILVCVMGCSSGMMINTIPEGAKVFDGDNLLGPSPYYYWDREYSGYIKELTLKKDGYMDKKVKLTKNVLYVHRIFLPPLFLLPWVQGYDVNGTFELDKVK